MIDVPDRSYSRARSEIQHPPFFWQEWPEPSSGSAPPKFGIAASCEIDQMDSIVVNAVNPYQFPRNLLNLPGSPGGAAGIAAPIRWCAGPPVRERASGH
jgi:hypothetical protein